MESKITKKGRSGDRLGIGIPESSILIEENREKTVDGIKRKRNIISRENSSIEMAKNTKKKRNAERQEANTKDEDRELATMERDQ